jgi:hypothetical protein
MDLRKDFDAAASRVCAGADDWKHDSTMTLASMITAEAIRDDW